MFERRKARLASKEVFRSRILKFSLISVGIFIFALGGGIAGYMGFGHMNLTDAFYNASMILGGMGPPDPIVNPSARIFAGIYALFCGIAFLLSMGIVITPIVHRFFHKFHADVKDEGDE